jgi:hypothetical protein
MSYQRKPLGSACARCARPVEVEAVAVRTLTRTLPYTPKIWHRPCFEAHRALEATAQPAAAPVRVACGGAGARVSRAA